MTKLETLYNSIRGLKELGFPLNEETLRAVDEMEKDVLNFLFKGKQPFILVMGRALYKQIPDLLQSPLKENRLLLISPVSQTIMCQSRQSCFTRNNFIINIADKVVFGSLDEKGSLYRLYLEAKAKGKSVEIIG